MRPDRASTSSSPSPGEDTEPFSGSSAPAEDTAAPPTPAQAVPESAEAAAPQEAASEVDRAPRPEGERATLVPEIDLEALAKLGPEAFAHRNQRLPADLFGPGGRPSAPVRTSLPPGASMAPRSLLPPSMRPASPRPSPRPKGDPFDLDEVDVLFDYKASVAPQAMSEEIATEPPGVALDATASLGTAAGSGIPDDARPTPLPPAAPPPTVPRAARLPVLHDADDEDEGDEPTLSKGIIPPPPRPPAPAIDTSDAIDALGMLDNPDSWDAPAAEVAPEKAANASLRPLATAALDALAELDEPGHGADDPHGDDLAVPVLSPLPPTQPRLLESTAPQGLPPSTSPPPIESLPSDLLMEEDVSGRASSDPTLVAAPGTEEARPGTDDDVVSDAGADEAMQELRERFDAKDYLGALNIAETLAGDRLHAEESEEIAAQCRSTLQARYVESIGSLARVPVIAVPLSVIRELPIDNRAGFVLSRIDGISSLEMILDMCGMSQLDALRIVYELLQNGALDFV